MNSNRFHGLPPHKRFKLQQQQSIPGKPITPSCLPAKKRKESPPNSAATTTTYCLPAKKRIWAPQPFDLNIEYQQETNTIESPKLQIQFEKLNGRFASPIESPKIETQPEKSNDQFASPIKSPEIQTQIGKPNDQFASITESPKKVQIQSEKPIDQFAPPIQSPKIQPQVEKPYEEKIEIQSPENEISTIIEENDEDGIVCAVCDSTDGDPTDPIVLCDGCDLMVHSSCYGHPFTTGIPDGDWFCAQCLAAKKGETEISCSLCPNQGGACKPTTDGRWAHLVCAIYVPEVFFADPEGREGINCSKVLKKRWEKSCYVCGFERNGCVIDCSEPKCGLGFHVTCGLKEQLCIEYRQGKKNRGDVIAAFCSTHTNIWKKQEQTGKFKIVARQD